MQKPKYHMFKSNQTVTMLRKLFAGLLALASLCAALLPANAATNQFDYFNTTVGAGGGPANPANGDTSIDGSTLNVGDVVVFDGLVFDVPGSGGDAWGAVNLDGGGYLGLVNAALGVLAETGSTSGNQWQLFLNGTGSSSLFGNATLDTGSNRIHIELTCNQAGSTTNMDYLVEIDQGDTGTYNDMLSGAAAVTFPDNIITLTFGANNAAHEFIQPQPLIGVSTPSPGTNSVLLGSTATFTAAITRGYPVDTAQQWLSNGVPIVGATSLTYTTPPTTSANNGALYSIVVTNLLVPGDVVTSSAATLVVRTAPGFVPFIFPNTTTIAGYGPVTDPGVSISGAQLQKGDTVVFDGILTPNGAQPSDAWTAINIDGAGYGNVTSATLGVLCRQGSGASQLFVNGSAYPANPTGNGAPTNRVRIEFYVSASGSTTNMGWLVEIDQNLSGVFRPAVSGTNLTFPGNTLPLTFGSSGGSSFVVQNPESPVAIFSGPSPASQVVASGASASVGVTVSGWYPAFQWRKNGVAIPSATNQSYTLPAATLADNGDQFTVVLSNRVNSLNVITSAVATVSVLIPNNLSWYPAADATTWDTFTANWTTNGGVSETLFANGNNVTFDNLGYSIGGSTVTVTNTVNPNGVTVNATASSVFVLTGAGSVAGQSLHLTGDGAGSLGLQAASSFATVTIDTGSTLDVGYGGTDDPAFNANFITNNGVIDFQNAGGVLTVAGVITGAGTISQDGAGTTVLSSPNSAYTINAINSGVILIASTPNSGGFVNNAEIQPSSPANVLVIPNSISGSGHFAFTGFQTTVLTGQSTFTGENRLPWSHVVVDNPQALGDANAGATAITGQDNFGGLYLSNNIIWTQPLELDPRLNAGLEATAPHLFNLSGTNDITSPLTFANGQGGSEINVEAANGQLTIDSAGTLANNANNNDNDLNLQGSAVGVWNGNLADSATTLYVVKRGTGVWTLGGADTYTGQTTVSGGTLLVTGQLSGSTNISVLSGGTLGGNGGAISGPVSVAAGGAIAPGGAGSGTLTIDNTLSLAAGSSTSVRINKQAESNDKILGLTSIAYGGTLVVSNLSGILTTNDSFPLFSAASYTGAFTALNPSTPGNDLIWNTNTLAIDGVLRIAAAAGTPPSPANITASVMSGGLLQLSWPAQQAWILEVQTNSLTVGLGSNWVPIPASAATNLVVVPVYRGSGAIFYRLAYP